MTQQEDVWFWLDHYLNQGVTDQTELITKVYEAEEGTIPRPTIRRAKNSYKKKLQRHLKILQGRRNGLPIKGVKND
jgi:hypothetical protein